MFHRIYTKSCFAVGGRSEKGVCVAGGVILRLGGIAVLKLCNFVFEIFLTPEPLSFKIGGEDRCEVHEKKLGQVKEGGSLIVTR